MSDSVNVRRGIYLYINGQEVKNDIRSIESEMNKLVAAQKKMAIGSAEYVAAGKKIGELKRIMAEHRSQWSGISKEISKAHINASLFSKVTDKFNKYFGVITAGIAALTGISLTIRKIAEENAKLDDTYADVMKTTNLTHEGVEELNEEFKKMDTRTTREELNKLAADAGKLGIQGKKDIIDFVDAGNQIKVSLGEDLGDGAIKEIGKITDVYRASTKGLDNLDLKGKMLAIGSAINELGESSTASEKYMVNFTQRLGGVAAQAGISIQNVLGYASALDQSGQAVEMSATSLQKFIMSLLKEPSKFANIAGLEIQSFNKLIKEDTNQAIITVLKALNQKGGFQTLIPVFESMSLDGARAVGVLSAMATNIDAVTTAQDIANKAFSDGTSITDEYNKKNNSRMAQLDKARKKFWEEMIIAGEALSPEFIKMTNLSAASLKVLLALIKVTIKYKSEIIALMAVIATYTIATKLHNMHVEKSLILRAKEVIVDRAIAIAKKIATAATLLYAAAYNALTGNITRATAALRLFNTVTKLNPWGLLIGFITAAAAAFVIFRKKNEDVTNSIDKTREKAAQQFDEESSRINALIKLIHNEKAAREDRLEAIRQLQSIIPEYNAQISAEGKITNENTAAINKYLEALEKKIKLSAIEEDLTEAIKKQGKLQKNETKQQQELNDVKTVNRKQEYGILTKMFMPKPRKDKFIEDLLTRVLEKTRKELQATNTEIEELKKEWGETSITIPAVKIKNAPDSDDGGTKTLEMYEIEYDRELAGLKKKLLNKKKSEEEYHELSAALEIRFLRQKQSLHDSSSKEYQQLQIEITDKLIAEEQRRYKNHDATYSKEEALLKKALAAQEIMQEDYNVQVLEKKQKYVKAKTVLVKEGSDEWYKLMKEEADLEIELRTARTKKADADYTKGEAILKKSLAEQQITQADYDLLSLEMKQATLKTKTALVTKESEEWYKLMAEEADNEIAIRAAGLKKTDADYDRYNLSLKKMLEEGKISHERYDKDIVASEIAYLRIKQTYYKKESEEYNALEAQITDKTISEAERRLKEESKLYQDKIDLAKGAMATREAEMAYYDFLRDNDLISEEEYQREKTKIEKKAEKERKKERKDIADIATLAYSSMLSTISSFIDTAQKRDERVVTEKFDAQIAAAEKNGQDTTALEEQKEASLLEIKKKYADKQFALQVLQITADTGKAIMAGWASTASLPFPVNMIMGAILTGMYIAQGAAQIAAANEQRNQAASLYSGGYTGNGNKHEEKMLIQTHGGEFVATKAAVDNPFIRPVLDVLNEAQRSGTVTKLTTADMATAVAGKPYYSGGYTSGGKKTAVAKTKNAPDSDDGMRKILIALYDRLNTPIEAYTTIAGKRGVNKQLNKYNKLTSNAER